MSSFKVISIAYCVVPFSFPVIYVRIRIYTIITFTTQLSDFRIIHFLFVLFSKTCFPFLFALPYSLVRCMFCTIYSYIRSMLHAVLRLHVLRLLSSNNLVSFFVKCLMLQVLTVLRKICEII